VQCRALHAYCAQHHLLTEFLVPDTLVFPFTIEAGNAIEVPIRFQPAVRGAQSATITVFSNDPAGPHTIALSNLPSGKLAVTGSTYFGEVDCGMVQKTVSICNVGDCKLHVLSVAFSRKRRHFRLINNPFPGFNTRQAANRSAANSSSPATIRINPSRFSMSSPTPVARRNVSAMKRTVVARTATKIAATMITRSACF
jgi:hypothetical protein